MIRGLVIVASFIGLLTGLLNCVDDIDELDPNLVCTVSGVVPDAGRREVVDGTD